VGTETHTASVLTGAFAAVGLETEVSSGASAAWTRQLQRSVKPCSQQQLEHLSGRPGPSLGGVTVEALEAVTCWLSK